MLLNLLLAWVSTALAVVLAFKIVVRIAAKRGYFKELNKKMRNNHKQLGIALMITGLLHGLLSTSSVFSANLGTVCFLLSLLFGFNYYLRKRLKTAKGWMFYHRLLTAGFVLMILLHVVDVGGIQIDDAISGYFGQGAADREIVYKDTENALAAPTETAAVTPAAVTPHMTTPYDSPPVIASAQTPSTPSPAPSDQMPYPTENVNAKLKDSGVVLKDGIYTGKATGFKPGLTVSVTVKDNLVTDIAVTAHNEVNKRFYGRPIAQIPQAIVESQSLEVDVVSGASRTSNGIIKAVRNALTKALVSGTFPGL